MNATIKTGCLGVKYPEFLQYGTDNIASISEQYEAILKSDRGKNLTKHISCDPRLKKLAKRKITFGPFYTSFNLDKLLLWYLWRINRVGENEADNELNNYLNTDCVPYFASVWMLNLKVDTEVELFDDWYLMPFELMPESNDKYIFHDISKAFMMRGDIATTALVKKITAPKTFDFTSNNEVDICEPLAVALAETIQLANLFALLNGCHSQIDSYAFYQPEHIPNGIFDIHSSTLLPVNRLLTNEAYEFKNPSDALVIENLYYALNSRSATEQSALLNIISRLSQAKNHLEVEDKILDLGIALEMLLLNDQSKNELSYRLAQRGAFLLTDKPDERSEIYQALKKLYDLRSSVAHTGRLEKNKRDLAYENIDMYMNFTEQICSQIICFGWPDWEKLTLGAKREDAFSRRTIASSKLPTLNRMLFLRS